MSKKPRRLYDAKKDPIGDWCDNVLNYYKKTSPLTKLIYLVICYFISWLTLIAIIYVVRGTDADSMSLVDEYKVINAAVLVVLIIIALFFHGWKVLFWFITSIISLILFSWGLFSSELGDAIKADNAPFIVELLFRIIFVPMYYIKATLDGKYQLIVVNIIYYMALAPILHYIFTYQKYKSELDVVLSSLTKRVKRLIDD